MSLDLITVELSCRLEYWTHLPRDKMATKNIFKRNFLNEKVRILIKISLKFVPKGPINNNPALV